MALNNDALEQQLISDLLIESFEGLDRFDREMLALEKGQPQPDTLNVIFRVIHTIKGTAGCIGLGKIESVAHVGESLLSLLRDGKLAVTSNLIGVMLEYSDALKSMLKCLETTGSQGDHNYSNLLQKLDQLQSTPEPKQEDPQSWGLFEDEPTVETPVSIEPKLPVKTLATEVPAAPLAGSVLESAIRVDVAQLDKLMNLVGELVLARNQIVQFTGDSSEPSVFIKFHA